MRNILLTAGLELNYLCLTCTVTVTIKATVKKQLSCKNENRFIFPKEWKNIKCSSFNKIPGNTWTVSHFNVLIWPTQQLHAYHIDSTGSEQLPFATVEGLQFIQHTIPRQVGNNYCLRKSSLLYFFFIKVHLSAKLACQDFFKYKIVLVWILCHCAV